MKTGIQSIYSHKIEKVVVCQQANHILSNDATEIHARLYRVSPNPKNVPQDPRIESLRQNIEAPSLGIPLQHSLENATMNNKERFGLWVDED